MEGGRAEGRAGGREGEREGGREGGREKGMDGWMEGGREAAREGGSEGGRQRGSKTDVEAVVRHALWGRCRDLISVAPEVAHAAARLRKKDRHAVRGMQSEKNYFAVGPPARHRSAVRI